MQQRIGDYATKLIGTCLLFGVILVSTTLRAGNVTITHEDGTLASTSTSVDDPNDFCGFQHRDMCLKEFNDAIARGEFLDPAASKALRTAPPRISSGQVNGMGSLVAEDVFVFEDPTGLLQSNFSDGALFNLMTTGANALIAEHGDQFDFIAFWVSANPHHQLGAAFYLPIVNDVSGIGDGTYNFRNSYGLNSGVVDGYIMMWEVRDWNPGTAGNASFTRLVLAQEFEHRWGMFLNPIVGGRALQGNDAGCGRSAHWSFRVDGQASGMEIREWVGSNPAVRTGGTLGFNTDIPGGVFSYTDLYLMGYVSPIEMDAGNSELRYMDNSCGSPYNGPIFNFGSAAIIQSNGVRNPTSATSQKDFRCAWVMIHPPGQPPTQGQLDTAAMIMEQQQVDWNYSTLGRGTLDNSLVTGTFSATPVIGEGPLNVQFTYDSTIETFSWLWRFGDGDSSFLQNPVHNYQPGLYDVELETETVLGMRFAIKRDFVTAWADTTVAPSIEAPYDTGSFYWDIVATNAVPIKEFLLPIRLTDAPTKVKFDSVSIVGTRADYFEQKLNVFNNIFFGEVVVQLRADNGGGSPPLPPGTGPILRVWVTPQAGAVPNDTITLSFNPISGNSLISKTITAEFEPVSAGGTVALTGPPCACDCHGNPQCDEVVNVFDVVAAVDVAFRSQPELPDPSAICPYNTTDVTCDDLTNVFDVVGLVDVAFRSADQEVAFCDPCGL